MIWALFLVFVVIFIWAMPFRPGLLRARLRSVACGEPSPAYPYRIFFVKLVLLSCFWAMFFWNYFLMKLCFLVELFFGRCLSGRNKKYHDEYILGDAFGPGFCGLAAARLLLRNEPSPAYPYRGNN